MQLHVESLIELLTEVLLWSEEGQTHICPADFYNENWLSRFLLLGSIREGVSCGGLRYGDFANWYAEGFLTGPFVPRYTGDPMGEGYTHPSLVIGDFIIDKETLGCVQLPGLRGQFGVIQAELGNRSFRGRKYLQNCYSKFSRILACLAYMTRGTLHNTFLYMAVPDEYAHKPEIATMLNRDFMIGQIEARFEAYADEPDEQAHEREIREVLAAREAVLGKARSCECGVLSYEAWIDAFPTGGLRDVLEEFKSRCYRFSDINRLGDV